MAKRFLGFLFVAVVISAPVAWAGEWKSLDGTEPETTSPISSPSSPANTGSKNSNQPQRSTGSSATDSDTALAMMGKKYKHAVCKQVDMAIDQSTTILDA